MCHWNSLWSSLELDAADFNGSVVLPVAADDLVLLGPAILIDNQFRMTPVRNDLAHDFGLRGVRPGHKFLFIGAHGQHVGKRDRAAHIARQGFDLDGVSRRYPVLLCSTSNDGVHRPSRYKSETLIIWMVRAGVNGK